MNWMKSKHVWNRLLLKYWKLKAAWKTGRKRLRRCKTKWTKKRIKSSPIFALRSESRINGKIFICLFVDFNYELLAFREYEAREGNFRTEKMNRMLEFDDQIEKLKNELDFCSSEDKAGKSNFLIFHALSGQY